LEAIAAAIGRPTRQRTTTYGPVPAERLSTQQRLTRVLPLIPAESAS
jgi:FO synthase